jgi:sulfatase maturation enzyme AslB (radical SAM superfamily)
MLVNISDVQMYLPARLKFALKPYYRRIFPNRLHVGLLPTARCNYRCSYCPVVTKFDYTSIYPKNTEKSAAEWHAALDRLPPAAIYIHGGEPFMYAGLAELINDLPKKHSLLGIVTNLSLPLTVYRKVKRKIHLNASLHREYVKDNEFLDKVRELSGQFHIHVNVVATPENLPVIETLAGEARARKVTLHVDPYKDPQYQYSKQELTLLERVIQRDRNPAQQLNYEDFIPKQCSAGRNYMVAAPNGDVFTCVAGYYYVSPLWEELLRGRERPEFAMGNLFDPAFRLSASDMICGVPCNQACDRDMANIRPAMHAAVASAQST